MILATFTKQPSERKDYDIDYSPWLSPVDDVISTVTVDVLCVTDATDVSLACDTIEFTSNTCKLWVFGGTDGARYKITVHVETVLGRKDESELTFKVKDY